MTLKKLVLIAVLAILPLLAGCFATAGGGWIRNDFVVSPACRGSVSPGDCEYGRNEAIIAEKSRAVENEQELARQAYDACWRATDITEDGRVVVSIKPFGRGLVLERCRNGIRDHGIALKEWWAQKVRDDAIADGHADGRVSVAREMYRRNKP